MINYKSEKEIDTIIFNELDKNLNIDTENADLVTKEFLNKVLDTISYKKKTISLLFSKNFSLTEHNIKRNLIHPNRLKSDPSIYDQVANTILSKRIVDILNRLMEKNKEDNKFVTVCMDRQLFINTILSENIENSLVESCLEEDEPLR